MVDGLAVLWEEVLEFDGVEGVVGREMQDSRFHTDSSSSQQVSGEVETRSEFFMAPEKVAPEHCRKTTMWLAFLWSWSVWTTVKAQRHKIASCGARMVANAIGMKKAPWMERGQWHTTDHRWIEKCNMNVLTAIRERVLVDWSRCQSGLLRDLCEGLEMSGTAVVKVATTPLE